MSLLPQVYGLYYNKPNLLELSVNFKYISFVCECSNKKMLKRIYLLSFTENLRNLIIIVIIITLINFFYPLIPTYLHKLYTQDVNLMHCAAIAGD